jgi:hypothetical protein
MIATFAIELCLAIYIALRYPSTIFRTVILTLLFCLASFQLAEYQVCMGEVSHALAWTKLGLVGISILPALGMHVIGMVTRHSFLIPTSYGIALLYALTFLFWPGATGPAECLGNYVILNIQPGPISMIYNTYYLFFLTLAILELTLRLAKPGRQKSRGYSRHLITLTLIAYVSFTLPMAIVAVLSASLLRAAPSIMCGFALFMALIVTLLVVPQHAKESLAMQAIPLESTAA